MPPGSQTRSWERPSLLGGLFIEGVIWAAVVNHLNTPRPSSYTQHFRREPPSRDCAGDDGLTWEREGAAIERR